MCPSLPCLVQGRLVVGDSGEDGHVGQVTQEVEQEPGDEQIPLRLQQFVQRLQSHHSVPVLGREGESQRRIQRVHAEAPGESGEGAEPRTTPPRRPPPHPHGCGVTSPEQVLVNREAPGVTPVSAGTGGRVRTCSHTPTARLKGRGGPAGSPEQWTLQGALAGSLRTLPPRGEAGSPGFGNGRR